MSALRVFSAIQPTGVPHVGNYFGAIKRWIDITTTNKNNNNNNSNKNDNNNDNDRSKKIFAVADLHALTVPHDSSDKLKANIMRMTASLLALGLDAPHSCIFFRQSQIPAHCELAWILSCSAQVPHLARQKQYKEKTAEMNEAPLGLLLYPVLQAADVLLYRSTSVPVGEDNVQNLEMTHHLARAFNRRFKKDVFPIPETKILAANHLSRVKSLRYPLKKMSKSEPTSRGTLFLDDEPDVIIEKCKKAVTDTEGRITFDPDKRPGVSNLVAIYAGFADLSPSEVVKLACNDNTAEFKRRLAELIIEKWTPVRKTFNDYMNNKEYLEQVLEQGRSEAEVIAAETMVLVRKATGLS